MKPERIAYYPGCSQEKMALEYDQSLKLICEILNIELVTIPDWNCCGSTAAGAYDPLLGASLAGRNLSIAEEEGFDLVMTPCPACLKALKGAVKVYNERPDDFLSVLGRPFSGKIKIVSILQLLYENVTPDGIKEKVQKSLTGKIIIPYYGCFLTRPPQTAQFDDPENPISMDKLLEAIGATVPAFPFKTECCGAAQGILDNSVVGKLSGRILDMAKRVGAQAICVACSMCQQNLDLRQGQVNHHCETNFNIPVIYLTQLIGYALGIEQEKLGFDKLIINPDTLF